jgi:beta-lactamase superfamily II metal-dependent hydrolase
VSEVIVLDVGHGNSAIALGNDFALLIDAPDDPAVLFAIADLRIERFDFVVISHRDRDHVAGLPAVLANSSLSIGTVFVPADATKNAASYQTKHLLGALADAKKSGRARVSRDLDDAIGNELSGGGLTVDVLAPPFDLAMGGPGGHTSEGSEILSNTTSAVIRVGRDGGGSVLLAGDADRVAFEALAGQGADLSADILVFPHHGRDSRLSNEREFAEWVCGLVSPEKVIFSVGRGAIARPSPDVVLGVKAARPGVYIACTQLCRECAPDPLPTGRTDGHLGSLPASGAADMHSCAGTLRISLVDAELGAPDPSAHQQFIDAWAHDPMCRRT